MVSTRCHDGTIGEDLVALVVRWCGKLIEGVYGLGAPHSVLHFSCCGLELPAAGRNVPDMCEHRGWEGRGEGAKQQYCRQEWSSNLNRQSCLQEQSQRCLWGIEVGTAGPWVRAEDT